jgi:hypothetical protein
MLYSASRKKSDNYYDDGYDKQYPYDAAPKIGSPTTTVRKLSLVLRFKIVSWRLQKMVKFQVRLMKKRYKGKEYASKKYQMEFPVKANPKIEPHKTKNFDYLDITSKDTPTQESQHSID